jgi:hypothetical protein
MARYELSQKDRNERKVEKNMFFMALTLCSISTLTRMLFMFYFVYLFFFSSFRSSLNVCLISYLVYTLEPTIGIFVFYSFNKMFRQVFKETFLRKLFIPKVKSTKTSAPLVSTQQTII